MTERLHNLIDAKKPQGVINERISTLFEEHKADLATLARAGSDHARRIRSIEAKVNYTLGGIGTIVAIVELVRFLHDLFSK